MIPGVYDTSRRIDSLVPLCHAVLLVAMVVAFDSPARAVSIDFRPALIPTGGPPLPVPLAIVPASPSVGDTIHFTAPLDGELHGNSCYASVALLGSPILIVDEPTRTIEIGFDRNIPQGCAAVYDPVVGAFGELGQLSAGEWTLTNSDQSTLMFTVSSLTGDFNGDGIVDAADYTVWRDTLGTTGVGLAADANGDEVVDELDYANWRANFGTSVAGSSFSSGGRIPEPATGALLLVGIAIGAARLWRQGRFDSRNVD